MNKIYLNFQILRNLITTRKKQCHLIENKIHKTDTVERHNLPSSKDKFLGLRKKRNAREFRSITHVTPRNRNSFAPLFDLACYTRLIHPRTKLSSGARGESKLYPDNPNFSRPYKNSARRGGEREGKRGQRGRGNRRQNCSTRRMILVELVSFCRAANRRSQRRPVDKHLIMERDTSSNEHSPHCCRGISPLFLQRY